MQYKNFDFGKNGKKEQIQQLQKFVNIASNVGTPPKSEKIQGFPGFFPAFSGLNF